MGILHVEQGALVVLGQLITGTGLEDVLVNAYLDIVSLKTALCDVSSIKKTRYSLQVVAHSYSGSSLTLEAWAELKCKSNPMFKYMYNILQLMILIIMLARSMREANFLLFIAVLQKLAPYFFAIDHTSYALWLSSSMTSRLCRRQTQIYTGYLELVNLLCSLLVRDSQKWHLIRP